jgi:hypothetical protein
LAKDGPYPEAEEERGEERRGIEDRDKRGLRI